jgi:hypothetical protein
MVAALESAGVNDGGLGGILNSTGARSSGLERLDDPHGLVISDLAEDDVAAIKPGGLDSGDKELRAVAVG